MTYRSNPVGLGFEGFIIEAEYELRSHIVTPHTGDALDRDFVLVQSASRVASLSRPNQRPLLAPLAARVFACSGKIIEASCYDSKGNPMWKAQSPLCSPSLEQFLLLLVVTPGRHFTFVTQSPRMSPIREQAN
jgi:hypothetical protein